MTNRLFGKPAENYVGNNYFKDTKGKIYNILGHYDSGIEAPNIFGECLYDTISSRLNKSSVSHSVNCLNFSTLLDILEISYDEEEIEKSGDYRIKIWNENIKGKVIIYELLDCGSGGWFANEKISYNGEEILDESRELSLAVCDIKKGAELYGVEPSKIAPLLKSEIDDWLDWANGIVYHFSTYLLTTKGWEWQDGCGGFIGYSALNNYLSDFVGKVEPLSEEDKTKVQEVFDNLSNTPILVDGSVERVFEYSCPSCGKKHKIEMTDDEYDRFLDILFNYGMDDGYKEMEEDDILYSKYHDVECDECGDIHDIRPNITFNGVYAV